jgi:hypothetical protein
MTHDEYVALLKSKLEAGAMSDRQIFEGAEDLKRRAEQRETVQGFTPRELLLLSQAIHEMVVAHNAAQINLPRQNLSIEEIFADTPSTQSLQDATEERATRLESPFGRLPASHYGWSDEGEDPEREERLEAEARRQAQRPRRNRKD